MTEALSSNLDQCLQLVYNEGRLCSLLCGLYADIFDYFWKLYSIKLKVSGFYL